MNTGFKQTRAAKIAHAGHIRKAWPVHYREPEQGGRAAFASLPRRGTQGKWERRGKLDEASGLRSAGAVLGNGGGGRGEREKHDFDGRPDGCGLF